MNEPTKPSHWRGVVTVLAIGAFLTFTNPFGATSTLPLWGAFSYWTGLVAIGWYGGSLISGCLRLVAPKPNSLVHHALATVLFTLLVAAAISIVQRAIGQVVPPS